MFNLEGFTLQLVVLRIGSTYINGDQLYDEVINYLPRLHQFISSIHTQIYDNRFELDLLPNDNIRKFH